MKSNPTADDAGGDPLAAQAIDGVLEAERDAQAAVAACEQAGSKELEAARQRARGNAGELKFARTRLFGLELLEMRWHAGAARLTERPVNPSPEARECARHYRALLEPLVMTAVCSLNLRRLMREYVRTERRARAIENVLLPEIEWSLKFVDEQLEILDQEERSPVCVSATRAARRESRSIVLWYHTSDVGIARGHGDSER